jgi:ribose 5-phosphate isomerase B
MAMAANKVAGIRAAPVVDDVSARLSREHNDANVLALGERLTPTGDARQLVQTFLDTPFGGGRHQRRVDKINALDHSSAGAAGASIKF